MALDSAALSHRFEHFAHLHVLAQHLIYFLHAGSGATRDTLAAAAGDQFVIFSLGRGHGVDDGFNAGELFFVDIAGACCIS